MKKNSWIYSIALLFLCCEKELPIQTNLAKKLTLYSILDTDRKVYVELYTSKLLTDSLNLDYISDATVELYENGNKISTLMYVDNTSYFNRVAYYTDTTVQIKPGKIYTIKATHPNYPSITATDTVPPITTINNAQIISNPITVINNDSSYAQLQFTITDDVNKYNIYIVYPYYYFSRYYMISATDSTLFWETGYANIKSINGINTSSLFNNGQISDDLFNGQSKQFTLEISKLFDFDNRIQEAYVGISIRQYSAAYYLDMESKRQYYELLSRNIYEAPYWFYSNVIGGFGLLTCTSNSNQVIARIK